MCVPFLSFPCGAVLMHDAGVRLALVLCAGGGASWATPTRFWTSYAMLVIRDTLSMLCSGVKKSPSIGVWSRRDGGEYMSRVCVRAHVCE
jgi:hypothetical protein